jgi:chaperone BCS1
MAYYDPADTSSWPTGATSSDANAFKRIVGFSVFASLFEGLIGGGNVNGGGGVNNAVMSSLRLFILGTIIETGRRLFQWVIERFKLFREYSFHSFLNFDLV